MARRVLIAALVLVSSLLIATPARAVITCAYDGTTKKVTISLDNGDVADVARQGQAITVDGTPCDVASVDNTDTIDVSSTGTAAELQIDLGGGAFAPGATPEPDAADSEIEWLVNLLAGSTLRITGSPTADNIVMGADGINLNATETTGDVDVVITGAPTLVLEGGDGDDTLSSSGGAGTGTNAAIATLSGEAGNDTLVPGAPGSTADGGDGADTVSYAGALAGVKVDLPSGHTERGTTTNDILIAIENATGGDGDDTLLGDNGNNALDGGAGNDTIDGGPGDDSMDGGAGTDTLQASGANAVVIDLTDASMSGQGTDTITAFENVKGSDGNDKITGNGEANQLDGGDGNDRIDGRTGPDDLRGGKGNDTVSFGSAKRHMEIDLRAAEGEGSTGTGTAKGQGADTLVGFENVDGGPKDDVIHGSDGANTLDGRSGVDEIYGQNGKDRVVGGNGADLLFGNNGSDVLLGNDGRDELDGGDGNDDVCKGGGDADAFVNCENFRTSVPNNVWYYEAGW